MIGASDAGAHLDLFLTANYATTMLNEAVVKRGLLPLEEAVHLLTEVQANLYGLVDRGVLAEGSYADVVVLDEATVGSAPTIVPLGPARRSVPPLRRGHRHRARGLQRHGDRARRPVHRRPPGHPPPLRPAHHRPHPQLNKSY